MKFFFVWMLWGPCRTVLLFLPYAAVRRLAAAFGVVAEAGFRAPSRFLRREYLRMFPGRSRRDIRRMVRRTLALLCLNEMDSLLHGKLTPGNIERELPVTGLERLRASMDSGRGVVLLTYHFGAHYQVMPALGHRGIELAQVANSLRSASVGGTQRRAGFWERRALARRERVSGNALPVEIIAIRSGSLPKSVFRRLKDKGVVVIAGDGRETGRLITVGFCGLPDYEFALGPVKLAVRTKAMLHPIFMVRDENNGCRSRLIIEEPIDFGGGTAAGDEDQRVGEVVRRLAAGLENRVMLDPSYYGVEMYNYSRSREKRE